MNKYNGFKIFVGETTELKIMPKSTKIRMLRNTSTFTCHEINLCVSIGYGILVYTLYLIPTILQSTLES